MSISNESSSLPSRGFGGSASKNPVFHLVNEFYAKQQAAYMQRRRAASSSNNNSGVNRSAAVAPVSESHDSVVLSPPTASRNTSTYVDASNGIVDTSAIHSSHNASTASTAPVDRLLRWSERREQALKTIREEEDRKLAALSTFQPNLQRARAAASDVSCSDELTVTSINTSSQSVAASQQHPITTNSTSSIRPSPLEVTERLLAQGDLSNRVKEHMRQGRDEELAKLHPFQPQIHTPRGEASGGSTTRQPVESTTTVSWDYKRGALQEPVSPLDPQCTFKPSVAPKTESLLFKRTNSAPNMETHNSRVPGNQSHSQLVSNGSDVFSRLFSQRSSLSATLQHISAVTSSNGNMAVADTLGPSVADELECLRHLCGAPMSDKDNKDYFEVFLANTSGRRVVDTTFQSLAFQALQRSRLNGSTDAHPAFSASSVEAESGDDTDSVSFSPHQFVLPSSSQGNSRVSREENSERVNAAVVPMASDRIINFNAFLQRQEVAYQQKMRKLAFLENQSAPPLKPVICEQSKIMVNQKKSMDQTKETTSSSPKPKQADRSSVIAVRSAAQFTFQPVITKVGASCPSRGVEDMHLDSQRKREKLVQRLKQSEEEAMAGVTFQPETNRHRNARVESTLNPKNFHIYQEHLERQRQMMEERRTDREEKELVEESTRCSFRPHINKTPAYISRMTTSTAALRDAGF